MTNLVNKKKKNNYRSVFRKQPKGTKKSIFRQSLESFVMLASATILAYILHTLPNKFDTIEIISTIISNLYQASLLIISALKDAIIIILVLLLISLCICLFLGSIIRILRITLRNYSTKGKLK